MRPWLKKLLVIALSLTLIALLLVGLAFIVPPLSDDREHIAPAHLELVIPPDGSAQDWIDLFHDSSQFAAGFDAIAKNNKGKTLDQGELAAVANVMAAAERLSTTTFDIPQDSEYPDPAAALSRFSGYITYVTNIPEEDKTRQTHLNVATRLSQRFLSRAKNQVHFLIASSAWRNCLKASGADETTYRDTACRSLGQALKGEYYYGVSQGTHDIESSFLFRSKHTWNEHWRLYNEIDQLLLKSDWEGIRQLIDSQRPTWTNGSLFNKAGEALIYRNLFMIRNIIDEHILSAIREK